VTPATELGRPSELAVNAQLFGQVADVQGLAW